MSWVMDVFDNSLIINSKVSLSRNIKGILFLNKIDDEFGRKSVNDIQNIFYRNSEVFNDFRFIKLWEDEEGLGNLNYEKLLIDYELIINNSKSAFMINKDETITIMINGNNHLKFQYITSELNLQKSFDEINKIDDLFEESLHYAFDEKLGYLSNNVMDLGLGLEVSALLHLPALTNKKKIGKINEEALKIGINIKNIYSENGDEFTNIYKIYNNTTMGLSEKNVISKLQSVINQVVIREQSEREIILNNFKMKIFDKIFKSFAILKNSYIISQKEAFELLSSVRMGVEMSIISNVDKKILNKLLVNTQPSALQNTFKQNDIGENVDIARAKYIRDILTNSV